MSGPPDMSTPEGGREWVYSLGQEWWKGNLGGTEKGKDKRENGVGIKASEAGGSGGSLGSGGSEESGGSGSREKNVSWIWRSIWI